MTAGDMLGGGAIQSEIKRETNMLSRKIPDTFNTSRNTLIKVVYYMQPTLCSVIIIIILCILHDLNAYPINIMVSKNSNATVNCFKKKNAECLSTIKGTRVIMCNSLIVKI